MTIEDFETLPDQFAHNHELVDGELVDVSGNTDIHNDLRDCLVVLLRPHAQNKQLGWVVSEQEFDFERSAHAPDVSFVSAARSHLRERGRRVQPFVPDLAIEIVSESEGYMALMRKANRYCRCGVADVWIFDQNNRQATQLSEDHNRVLGENDFFESRQMPGFSIRIGKLFDEA